MPGIDKRNNNYRSKEIQESGGKHDVEAAAGLLGEGDAAPGRLLHNLAIIQQVVHLGVEGPGKS